jgi:sec-independent protein translocase protein TatC
MPPQSHAEMPFLDHLEELRWRIIWSLVAVTVGVGIGFYLLTRFDLFLWVEQPILPYLPPGHHLIVTHPADPFRFLMVASLVMGTILALPVILWHIWGFLSPALYRHEKRIVIPVLISATLLFLAGCALSWFFILPMTLRLFTSIQSKALDPMFSFEEYSGFAISMTLAMGAVFELPIAILGLSALGLVTPALLNRFRRYAIILAMVVAAFITPGQDPFSLMALTIPLYLLYEVSVGASALVQRRRQRRERERELEEARERDQDRTGEAGAPA